MLRMVTSRAGSGVLSEQYKLDVPVAHLGIDAYFQSLVVHKLAHGRAAERLCVRQSFGSHLALGNHRRFGLPIAIGQAP
jgi:hypothetical protein